MFIFAECKPLMFGNVSARNKEDKKQHFKEQVKWEKRASPQTKKHILAALDRRIYVGHGNKFNENTSSSY